MCTICPLGGTTQHTIDLTKQTKIFLRCAPIMLLRGMAVRVVISAHFREFSARKLFNAPKNQKSVAKSVFGDYNSMWLSGGARHISFDL
jgi:hypothetical protein